jgi:hypothetical protein
MNTEISLTPLQPTKAVMAYQTQQVAKMPDIDLMKVIQDQCKLVCTFSGQQPPENLDAFSILLASALKKTNCTIGQFKEAIADGLQNDTIFSASAPLTYIKWVNLYMDKVRMEIAAYRRLKQAEPKPEPTEAEKMRNAIEHILSMYDKWKAGHEFVDGGSAGYLWLESVGEIHLTIDEKVEQFEASRERAIKAIQARKEDSTKFEARSIDKLLLEIQERPNDIPELRFEQVKICRNDLLKEYFMANELTFEYLKQRYETQGS